MIVDLVRATNDHRDLGFTFEGRHVNVLLSRQQQALVIVDDKDYATPAIIGDIDTDTKKVNKRNGENKHVLRMFKWLETEGRIVDVSLESLPTQYIDPESFSIKESEPLAVDSSLPGAADSWGGSAPFWPSEPAVDNSAIATSDKKDSTPARNSSDAWGGEGESKGGDIW